MTLDELEREKLATILAVDWAVLDEAEGKRLRALGVDEGTSLTVTHRGIFGGADPLAVTIGRMTIAMRRAHAAAVTVEISGQNAGERS